MFEIDKVGRGRFERNSGQMLRAREVGRLDAKHNKGPKGEEAKEEV